MPKTKNLDSQKEDIIKENGDKEHRGKLRILEIAHKPIKARDNI